MENKDLNKQISDLDNKIEDLRKAIIDSNKYMVDSFKIVDKNFETLEGRLNAIDGKIDALAQNSSKEFESVGGQLSELKEEVIKIQKVSNYPEQYENLLRITK